MNIMITLKRMLTVVVVATTLAMLSPASYAQQQIAEEMLDQSLEQKQQVADEAKKQKHHESGKNDNEVGVKSPEYYDIEAETLI